MLSKLVSLVLCIAMLFSLCACSDEAVSLIELPDPADSVDRFFDYLKNEEYDKADEMVYNYVTLGLSPNESIDDPILQAFCRKLTEQRMVSIVQEPQITGKTAVMTIRLTTIDLRKIYEPLSANVTETIHDMRYNGEKVDTDEDIAAVTLDELNKLIEENGTLATAEVFTVEFIYTGGEWLLVISDELYSAIIGYAV